MTTLAIHESERKAIVPPLPEPRVPGGIAIRLAELKDLPFIDALQKQHNKMVGFMPRAWVEDNIEKGNVLLAVGCQLSAVGPEAESRPPKPIAESPPLGYIIFKDRYLKREELGIVHQLNVLPNKQRGLVGANLLKAAFERSAYGCKLFCCWCAQDLQANHFWESVGFVPIAFRAGSRQAGKRVTGAPGSSPVPRIHIFWQRRIREGDNETPYWFPSETTGGAMREARIVLPIPPGTHWSDAKPAVFPGGPGLGDINSLPTSTAETEPKVQRDRKRKDAKAATPQRPKRGLWFVAPGTNEHGRDARAIKLEKPKRNRQTFKNDPKYVKAARELRDRYLEQVNADRMLPAGQGKYDVSRQLQSAASKLETTPLLDAA